MNRLIKDWKSYHPIVKTLMIGTMLTTFTSSMSMPFLAIFLMSTTNLSAAQIGLILGAGPLTATFSGFIGGMLSDFFGRKKLMFLSIFTLCFVFLGFIWAKDPWFLMLLSIFRGIFSSFFVTVSKTLMGDLTPEANRYQMFSYRYYAINIGFTIGPMLGAAIGLAGNSNSFLATAFMYFIYGFVLICILSHLKIKDSFESEMDQAKSLSSMWSVLRKDKVLFLFMVGGIFLTTVHGQISVLLSQHLKQNVTNGISLFGVLMSINGFTVIIAQLPLTKWSEKLSLFNRMIVGSGLLSLGVCGFALSEGWTGFLVSMVIFTFGEIVVVPTEYAQIDLITPNNMRGTYYGVQNFSELGSFMGPWIGGILLASFGGKTMFLTLSVFALFSLVFYSAGWKVYRNKYSSSIKDVNSINQ